MGPLTSRGKPETPPVENTAAGEEIDGQPSPVQRPRRECQRLQTARPGPAGTNTRLAASARGARLGEPPETPHLWEGERAPLL